MVTDIAINGKTIPMGCGPMVEITIRAETRLKAIEEFNAFLFGYAKLFGVTRPISYQVDRTEDGEPMTARIFAF